MTFYEMTRTPAKKLGFLDGISEKVSAGVKVLQYSRMVQALSGMSDAQLAAIDLERKDIPAHAHRCIYEE